MSLSTPADFKLRYDARILGDLVNDTGSQISPTGLDTDTVLQQMLDDAYGEMVASLLVGARYSEADLASLTGASLNYAKRIECDLALYELFKRRVYSKASPATDAIIERAVNHIKNLSNGAEVFSLPTTAAASKVVVTGPTTTQLRNLNTIRRRTNNYFPTTPQPDNR